jgi:hypothetical protein
VHLKKNQPSMMYYQQAADPLAVYEFEENSFIRLHTAL